MTAQSTDALAPTERDAFEAFIADLTPGQQANIRESMERGESLTLRAFQAGRASCADGADAKDAQRYRWLRDQADRDDEACPYIGIERPLTPDEDDEDGGLTWTEWVGGEEADAAIDAAIAAAPKEQQ